MIWHIDMSALAQENEMNFIFPAFMMLQLGPVVAAIGFSGSYPLVGCQTEVAHVMADSISRLC